MHDDHNTRIEIIQAPADSEVRLAAERNGPPATSLWRSPTPSEDDGGDVDGVRRRRRDPGDDQPYVGPSGRCA